MVLFIALTGNTTLPTLRAGAADAWTIDAFAAEITIQPDASLLIVESIDVDFGSLQKHGIFREIPVRSGTAGTKRATGSTG